MNTRAGLRIGKTVIGGLSGVLHYWSSIVLLLKGYQIVGLFPVDLPSNWISLHPAVRKRGVAIIYAHVEQNVRRFAEGILNQKRNYKALSIRDVVLDLLISPVSVAYNIVGKYFFAKSYIASSQCNHCGICEKVCPVQAIKNIRRRMFWTLKCESCMKCMNICPQRAIETAHGFFVMIGILTSFIVGIIINILFNHPAFTHWQWLQHKGILFSVKTLVFFSLLLPGYGVMHRLMRFRLFERLFVCTSFTKFRFWGRYKAPRSSAIEFTENKQGSDTIC